MRKLFFYLLLIGSVAFLSSCEGTQKMFLPQTSSMVKAVSFKELNLTGKDYEILNRIEATATLNVAITSSSMIVDDPDGLFHLEYFTDPKTGIMSLKKFSGIVRTGYLTRELNTDDGNTPEALVRKMAVFRLINLVREQGGDGIIEPVVSTDFEDVSEGGLIKSKTKLTFRATVSGKVVRLK